jgi:hypothetical protein
MRCDWEEFVTQFGFSPDLPAPKQCVKNRVGFYFADWESLSWSIDTGEEKYSVQSMPGYRDHVQFSSLRDSVDYVHQIQEKLGPYFK